MSYYIYSSIDQRRWYYRLKDNEYGPDGPRYGLFHDTWRNNCHNKLLVRASVKKGNKITNLFTVFDSYIEFAQYHYTLSPDKRCFYEIVLGEYLQKPHFDIDIEDDVDGDQICQAVIDSIISVMSEHGVNLNLRRDVLIYTSHGGGKQSYHIIIGNHAHADNIQASNFYNLVIGKLDPSYVKYIDGCVYTKTQQFRMIDSHKIDSDRVKTFSEKWTYHDQVIEHEYVQTPANDKHRFVLQLEEGVITFTDSCAILPSFAYDDPNKDEAFSVSGGTGSFGSGESGMSGGSVSVLDKIGYTDVTRDLAKAAFNLLVAQSNLSPTDRRFPYRLDKVETGVIMLKRVRPSMCKICKRIHHNENPYLIVRGMLHSVFFDCRRRSRESKMWYIGDLINPLDTDNPEDRAEMDEIEDLLGLTSPKRLPDVKSLVNDGSTDLKGKGEECVMGEDRDDGYDGPSSILPDGKPVRRSSSTSKKSSSSSSNKSWSSSVIDRLVQLSNKETVHPPSKRKRKPKVKVTADGRVPLGLKLIRMSRNVKTGRQGGR